MDELLASGAIEAGGRYDALVAGRALPPASGDYLPVIDPASGRTLCHIARGGAADVAAAAAAGLAARAGDWGRLTATERGRLLLRFADLILEHREQIARVEALDTGKPLSQALTDVVALARYFEYYGAAADKVHGETIPYQNGYLILTRREPYGVTGHIIPWNYPVQMFGRSVAPALAMGNACVVKPAEHASLSSLMLGWLAIRAGFPPGALNIVTGLGGEAGAALAEHPDISFISFTGSPRTGTLVQQAAAIHHKPVALELGGKSPQIVFDDADLDAATPVIVRSIVQNAGQTCSAGSRLLVQDGIYDELMRRLAEAFRALKVGPGGEADVGPLINAQQRDQVEGYLAAARREGLTIVAQGQMSEACDPGGYFVPPTLLGEVPAHSQLAQEEIFGPVLAAIRFAGEDEAVRIANDTPYGLVAGVWTADGGRQLRVAERLQCGQVYINNFGAGGGVELPFGGVKRSGHGREKGFEALLHFSVTKTVAIKYA